MIEILYSHLANAEEARLTITTIDPAELDKLCGTTNMTNKIGYEENKNAVRFNTLRLWGQMGMQRFHKRRFVAEWEFVVAALFLLLSSSWVVMLDESRWSVFFFLLLRESRWLKYNRSEWNNKWAREKVATRRDQTKERETEKERERESKRLNGMEREMKTECGRYGELEVKNSQRTTKN